ncbi:MAG: FdtA/QdtA family cupin domain-containing protein [Firmicutes bacterium]|nr:FdtA/QdtA family cupin domain-containing protein [Bacillota bacterium]
MSHIVKSYPIIHPYLREFPQVSDIRGNLTYIEPSHDLPFLVRRLYYLYDIPPYATRGGHAHRTLYQCLIALAGSFDVVVEDGLTVTRYTLAQPTVGLVLPPMVWRELDHFLPHSICLVLASDLYNEGDYIRNHDEFHALLGVTS